MGKPYYWLDYPQGSYLLTKSEFEKAEKKKLSKNLMDVNVKNSKGYYRFQEFISRHPTFAKKVR
jgi:hypothetical protein